jgi:hypothetical protein
MNPELLRATLAVAVPMWAAQVRGWSDEKRAQRGRVCAQAVAEHGDVIQFKAKGTADAFNRLAEGLALLSFAPGGVRFLGDHWESK